MALTSLLVLYVSGSLLRFASTCGPGCARFAITSGFLRAFGQLLSSWWLVRARVVALDGHAWRARGWITVLAWTVVLAAAAAWAYRRDTAGSNSHLRAGEFQYLPARASPTVASGGPPFLPTRVEPVSAVFNQKCQWPASQATHLTRRRSGSQTHVSALLLLLCHPLPRSVGDAEPWIALRAGVPGGPLFCVLRGPTCGRRCGAVTSTDVRGIDKPRSSTPSMNAPSR